MSNNTTNKVHKFINHKYIHRSDSATCFGLRLKGTQDLYILLITLNSSADRSSKCSESLVKKQPVYMLARTVKVYFHKPLVSNLVCQKSCISRITVFLNPLSPELNPICYLLALLDHHILHVSRIRVKSLTLRLLMSYMYGAPILDVSRSHTTTQHSR